MRAEEHGYGGQEIMWMSALAFYLEENQRAAGDSPVSGPFHSIKEEGTAHGASFLAFMWVLGSSNS